MTLPLSIPRSGAAVAECERVIVHHSRSFSLAARTLPPRTRADSVVLYAWCRRADDLIDHSAPTQHAALLWQLRQELKEIYSGTPQRDASLAEFQRVVFDRAIPSQYPEELIQGLEMDMVQPRYGTLDELLVYCYRVAGTVGLMMCHILGVNRTEALKHAAHLGIAMQLSNICRDVLEDWQRERLYLPEELLTRYRFSFSTSLGDTHELLASSTNRVAIRNTVAELLTHADRYYASADTGLQSLDFRSALAIRCARLVYSEIGTELRKRLCDPLLGRAFVPAPRKAWLLLRAVAESLANLPTRLASPGLAAIDLSHCVRSADDVIPL